MRVIVDAFGGDNAPLEILKGCAMAVQEYGVDIIACGSERVIRDVCEKNKISLDRISIADVEKVIPVEVDSTEIVKSYDDCTMAVGLKMLANGEGDAFVSAGSTGEIVVGASLFVKRIKDIKRAALATVIPSQNGCYMLLDMGAEETKGMELQVQAHQQFQNAPVNFIGNIEPRDLPFTRCDVAVADGFTGNIVLKLTEGLGSWFAKELKGVLLRNFVSKIGTLFVAKGVVEFKKKMDYTEYGGAPLMGITRPVIKAHGSSNAKAFKNAIRQAKEYTERGVITEIVDSLAQLKARGGAGL